MTEQQNPLAFEVKGKKPRGILGSEEKSESRDVFFLTLLRQ